MLICYNDPESHPFITEKERDYLRSEIRQTKRGGKLPPTPWKQIFLSIPVIALVASQVHLYPMDIVHNISMSTS